MSQVYFIYHTVFTPEFGAAIVPRSLLVAIQCYQSLMLCTATAGLLDLRTPVLDARIVSRREECHVIII